MEELERKREEDAESVFQDRKIQAAGTQRRSPHRTYKVTVVFRRFYSQSFVVLVQLCQEILLRYVWHFSCFYKSNVYWMFFFLCEGCIKCNNFVLMSKTTMRDAQSEYIHYHSKVCGCQIFFFFYIFEKSMLTNAAFDENTVRIVILSNIKKQDE